MAVTKAWEAGSIAVELGGRQPKVLCRLRSCTQVMHWKEEGDFAYEHIVAGASGGRGTVAVARRARLPSLCGMRPFLGQRPDRSTHASTGGALHSGPPRPLEFRHDDADHGQEYVLVTERRWPSTVAVVVALTSPGVGGPDSCRVEAQRREDALLHRPSGGAVEPSDWLSGAPLRLPSGPSGPSMSPA